MYFQDLSDSSTLPAVYRYHADADRYSAHPEYKPHQPDRNRFGLPDGYAVPHRRTKYPLLSTRSDIPVLLLSKIQHGHGFPLKSGHRSDAAARSIVNLPKMRTGLLRTWK